MKTKFVLIGFLSVFFPVVMTAQDLEKIPEEVTRKLAERLSEEAGKIEKPQIKVETDVTKANGVHLPEKLGLLVIPQKDLKESAELDASFQKEPGAAIGVLFMYHLTPLADGKKVDSSRLRTITFEGDDGEGRPLATLLLAVRKLADDDYRLHVYGKDAMPLVDARFSEGTGPGAEPVAVELKDIDHQKQEGSVVITVFGKYQASFRVGYTGE